jgi:hypothetical protein
MTRERQWVPLRVAQSREVGASPTRQVSLQPAAIGAVVKVTKRLKPSV